MPWCILLLPCQLLVTVLVLLASVRLWLQIKRTRCRARDGSRLTVAFFHPYCNAGGGGERVLWCAIRALQDKHADVECAVYAGEERGVTGQQIVDGARERFGVALARPVRFVFLRRRALVEPALYPRLTLLGQSLGSVVLAWEALTELVPDVYVDSTGHAFTLPLFRYLGGCRTASYVHYPTVSADMLSAVRARSPAFNNADRISRSRCLSAAKVAYYRLFGLLYGAAGACCDVVMVNSSWTLGHVEALWRRSPERATSVVYPPCDVAGFLDVALDEVEVDGKGRSVVSVGQFRPEKDHRLQIRAFKKLLDRRGGGGGEKLRLVLVGGCRNREDEDRVAELKELCEELDVAGSVEFKVNASREELRRELGAAAVGLHAMRNEHFGIGVVECMAAGTVVLAHRSGGPLLDIVEAEGDGRTGFLAEDEDGFADAMDGILALLPAARLRIRRAARRSVARFSDREFEARFLAAMEPLLMGTLSR